MSGMTKIKLIIDCDPGVDDAVGLLLAFGTPDQLDILGVTTVAGNVSLVQTARNACAIRDLADAHNVPVFAGCPRPLVRAPVLAADFHGENGLGNLNLDASSKDVQDEHGVAFLIRSLRAAAPASITLAMMGPLTNLAAALVMAPDIRDAIQKVIVMGGARSEGGNITATAEYNIFADPHAAHIVLDAGVPIVLMGLDATHQVRATPERVDALRQLGGARALFAARLLDFCNAIPANVQGSTGSPLHDPCTIAYLLDPEAFKTVPAQVRVETGSEITMGATSVEFRVQTSLTQWVTHINADRIFTLLQEALRPS
jgi:purine nucleosidase